MSGSVAEALLASGSKKLPLLLPPPPKLKKDPETFTFELELAESNEQTYPEFSWMELVKNTKQKELSKKVERGAPTLNPYASDDEEDLKAMAAKFEAKYSNTTPSAKKKKRRAEDYIDRGAGYDESDPFIDNSDVYDEVVPADLQTVHGGFYINSGSLDFKEVELSEDEDDSLSSPPKMPKVKKAKTKITPVIGSDIFPKKNPVGRPPGVGNKRPIGLDKSGLPKKRKILHPPIVGPDGKIIIKPKKIIVPIKPEFPKPENSKPENPKPKVMQISSSSASSSSSSSEESSSSTDSESSSSEETEEKKEVSIAKNIAPLKVKASSVTPILSKQMPNITRHPDANVVSSAAPPGPTQPKRIKTKNVPLNPKLHPNLAATTVQMVPTTSALALGSYNMTPPQSLQSKGLTKDLIKSNGGGNVTLSPRTLSPSGVMPILPQSASMKVCPPKPVSTPTISPGVTISAVNPQAPKSSNNVPSKSKIKNKLPTNSASTVVSPSQLDIFSTLAAGYSTLPNLSSFTSNLAPGTSILKNGMSLLSTSKAMPNLKKMTQVPSAEKLVQKQPKAAVQKPVKTKIKQTINPPITPPTSHTSAFTTGSSGSTYLSNLSTYKTPPPLAGPGVEISKVRTSVINSGISSSPPNKVISNANSFSSAALGLATVSLAHTSNNSHSLTSNSMITAGISSILNSSPGSLVNNVPSSLTVQRLPQSITITPTSQQSAYSMVGMTASSTKSLNMEPKAPKHISAFDVSALLQNPVVSYANTLLSLGNAKSNSAKSSHTVTNNRDMQRK